MHHRAHRTLRTLALLGAACMLASCGGGSGSGTGGFSPPVAGTIASGSSLPANPAYELSQTGGQEWPTFAHDEMRTGYQPLDTGITPSNVKKLGLRWSFQVPSGEQFFGGPIVVNGIVYVAALDSDVYALNAQTGKVVWKKHIPDKTVPSKTGPVVVSQDIWMTPSYYDGYIFIGKHNGTAPILYALDAATGAVRWSQSMPGALRSAPVVMNGKLYLGTATGDPPYCHPGGISEIDAATGDPGPKWLTAPNTQQDGGGLWGPISTDGTSLYTGTGNTCNNSPVTANAIVKVSPTSLETGWHLQTADGMYDWDVASGVMLLKPYGFSVGKIGKIYDVKLSDGFDQWATNTGAPPGWGGYATPTYTESTLVVSGGYATAPTGTDTTTGGMLLGVNPANGTIRWRRKTNYVVFASAVSTQNLVFAELDQDVVALNPTTGKVLWSYTSGGDFKASPAVGPSGLFAADLDGTLYAFGIGGHAAKPAQRRFRPRVPSTPKFCLVTN